MIGGPLDTLTWRVYSVEQSIDPGPALDGVQAARYLVRRVKRSAWWRNELIESPTIRTKLGGAQTERYRVSWAAADAQLCPSTWTLNLHPGMLNEIVVLHELAHCLAPRRWGDPKQLRRERLTYGELPIHGPAFTGILSDLVGHFGAGVNHEDLQDAYKHFEVPVSSMTEVRAAVEEGREVETLVLAIFDELESRHEARESERIERGEPPQEARIPTIEWGYWLMHMRRWGARRGQRPLGRQRLADMISVIERCTPRDIQTIEEAEAVPEDPRLRRIAMARRSPEPRPHLDPVLAPAGPVGVRRRARRTTADQPKLGGAG